MRSSILPSVTVLGEFCNGIEVCTIHSIHVNLEGHHNGGEHSVRKGAVKHHRIHDNVLVDFHLVSTLVGTLDSGRLLPVNDTNCNGTIVGSGVVGCLVDGLACHGSDCRVPVAELVGIYTSSIPSRIVRDLDRRAVGIERGRLEHRIVVVYECNSIHTVKLVEHSLEGRISLQFCIFGNGLSVKRYPTGEFKCLCIRCSLGRFIGKHIVYQGSIVPSHRGNRCGPVIHHEGDAVLVRDHRALGRIGLVSGHNRFTQDYGVPAGKEAGFSSS